jgi:hypothetical protein
VKLLILGFAVVALVGCGARGAPSDQAPGWVQTLDKLNGVVAKIDAGTGKTVVTQTTPDNPLSSTGPIGGVAVSALALAWYFIRKQAAAHENMMAVQAQSVPAASHDQAVAALAASTPATVTESTTKAT